MDKFIAALAPLFAAGFAVQQLLEIITSFFDLDPNSKFQKYKKPILGIVALGLGCALSSQLADLGVLHTLKEVKFDQSKWLFNGLDFLVTALVISAGTEGVNSILKFLKYAKEDKKRDAAANDPKNSTGGLPVPAAAGAGLSATVPRVPTEDALSRINRQ
jgi:hypothetical protein